MKVLVIDYQLGNINSIINMLKKIGAETLLSNKAEEIAKADKLILPGVGAYDHGMQNLQKNGLVSLLQEEVLERKKPILGICLGMQLLLEGSEEGKLPGLGWLPGHCVRFKSGADKTFKIPHMGWNKLIPTPASHFLATSENAESRFYFVHSYHANPERSTDVIAHAHYGYLFPAVIGREHILGAQFHPEKSHRYGMEFLKKFIEYSFV